MAPDYEKADRGNILIQRSCENRGARSIRDDCVYELPMVSY